MSCKGHQGHIMTHPLTWINSSNDTTGHDATVLKTSKDQLDIRGNYSALLQHLGVKAATVELPYVIHSNTHGVSEFYTQPGSASGLDRQLRPSLEERGLAQVPFSGVWCVTGSGKFIEKVA